jgi:ABC-type lipoprotein release transport system permease subunit
VVTSVTVLLVALATVATIVPAWRAGRTDPAVALRTD